MADWLKIACWDLSWIGSRIRVLWNGCWILHQVRVIKMIHPSISSFVSIKWKVITIFTEASSLAFIEFRPSYSVGLIHNLIGNYIDQRWKGYRQVWRKTWNSPRRLPLNGSSKGPRTVLWDFKRTNVKFVSFVSVELNSKCNLDVPVMCDW